MYLKEIETKKLDVFTPTRWQTVILRNYGLVPTSNIAKVLNCSTKVVETEAKRLGIDYISYDENYLNKSFITIIRNNWHLLSYKQLITLLDRDESWLDNELKNNDFLWYKLGGFKPLLDDITYKPLTKEEKLLTNRIRKIVIKNRIINYKKPFEFDTLSISSSSKEGIRIVYPYCVNCGELFLQENIISDEELINLKNAGINGIWLHGLLNEFSINKFKKDNDSKYLIRRSNLQKLIDQANKYGIKIYLYFNEPRCLKIDEVKEEYSYLIGKRENDDVAMCLSFKEVQENFYNSCKDLFSNIHSLGGVITITASENLTYCKHILGSDCPHCKDIPPYQTAALINNLIQKAIDDSDSDAIVIANLWGWAPYCGFSDDDVKKGIKLLDKKINVDDYATLSKFGIVKPDGVTITINEDGLLTGSNQYELPTASSVTLGGVKVDGQSIVINDDGVISSSSKGGVDYLEEEQLLGVKWITGDEIYQSSILFNTPINCVANQWNEICPMINRSEILVDCFVTNNNNFVSHPDCKVDDGNIYIYPTRDYLIKNINIQYTKTAIPEFMNDTDWETVSQWTYEELSDTKWKH